MSSVSYDSRYQSLNKQCNALKDNLRAHSSHQVTLRVIALIFGLGAWPSRSTTIWPYYAAISGTATFAYWVWVLFRMRAEIAQAVTRVKMTYGPMCVCQQERRNTEEYGEVESATELLQRAEELLDWARFILGDKAFEKACDHALHR